MLWLSLTVFILFVSQNNQVLPLPLAASSCSRHLLTCPVLNRSSTERWGCSEAKPHAPELPDLIRLYRLLSLL